MKLDDIEIWVKIQGDAGERYRVADISWTNLKARIDRACGLEWVDFNRMKVVDLFALSEIKIIRGVPIPESKYTFLKNMMIKDCVKLMFRNYDELSNFQNSIYLYQKKLGFKFKTKKTNRDEDSLNVWRVK